MVSTLSKEINIVTFFLSFQSNIPEAIQHYLLALQLEPGFTPAVERLKIIQCVLWKQQKALEKEANDLRKLLATN